MNVLVLTFVIAYKITTSMTQTKRNYVSEINIIQY